MDTLVQVLADSPLPTVFVITGLLFIFLAIAGGISGRIELPEGRERIAGATGVGLMIVGIILFLVSSTDSVETPADVAPAPPPSIEPTETAALPTPTADVTEEPIDEQAAAEDLFAEARLWPLVLLEQFDSADTNWSVGPAQTELTREVRTIEDGVFRWTFSTTGPNTWNAIRPPAGIVSDIFISTLIRVDSGTVDDGVYGVYFRWNEHSMYRFGFRSKGLVELARLYDGTFTLLVSKPYDINHEDFTRFTAIVDDEKMYLFINSRFFDSVRDDTALDPGNVGIYLGLDTPDHEVVVEFDDFELREKP